MATTKKTGRGSREERDSTSPQSELSNVLAEIGKISEMLKGVVTDVAAIKQNMSELKETVANMGERITEAETRISRLEDDSEKLMAKDVERGKEVNNLWSRVQALESHSRRNNVRVIGLKENIGTEGTLMDVVRGMLVEGLGMSKSDEYEIERAHRAFAPLPDPEKPPRPVLVRFLRQSARDKIIDAAKKKRGFEWRGCRLSVFPDMTKELAEKRKEFAGIKKRLHQHNVKCTLAFPATLRVRWKGRNLSFGSAKAAERYFDGEEKEKSNADTTE